MAAAENNIYINLINRVQGLSNLAKQMNQLEELNLLNQKTEKGIKAVNKVTKTEEKQLASLRRTTKRFKAEWMSIMFGGMAAVRIFNGIIKGTLDTFTKMTQGTGKSMTAITALTAAWTYLKFSIGDAINSAIAPLIPMIIQVVTWLVDWIDQHPVLTAAILGTGLALGYLALVVGSLQLLLGGLISAGLIPAGTTLTSLLGPIGWVALALVLLWLAFKTNLGNIKGFVSSSIENISIGFKGLKDLILAIANEDTPLLQSALKELTDFMGRSAHDQIVFLGNILIWFGNKLAWVMSMLSGKEYTQMTYWKYAKEEMEDAAVAQNNNASAMTFLKDKLGILNMSLDESNKKIAPYTSSMDQLGTSTTSLTGNTTLLTTSVDEWYKKQGLVIPQVADLTGKTDLQSTSFMNTTQSVRNYITALDELYNKSKRDYSVKSTFSSSASGGGKSSRQFGGIIPSEGLYHLHAGEYVLPTHRQNNNWNMGDMNVRVNTGPVSNNVDVNRMANTVSDMIMTRIKRNINPTTVGA